MILLRANTELKTIFNKMINTMGERVDWSGVFIINNNDIILSGKLRSLFFNFDSRKAFSNIVELPVDEEKARLILDDTLLENTLNMILYAFGKWGTIRGLKVETDYNRLNMLIDSILKEISVQARLSRENFRFYKNNIQITYEEVIEIILTREKEKELAEEPEEIAESEYEVGLWHNICWDSGKFSFVKEKITQEDRKKSRIGNNFYMVDYKCPECGAKLYMAVYPPGKEYKIETGVEPLYMVRVYTCNECSRFYTPWPYKHLMDGDVFTLWFEDDRQAYEDYMELLGANAERISNGSFNLFESEYNKKEHGGYENPENSQEPEDEWDLEEDEDLDTGQELYSETSGELDKDQQTELEQKPGKESKSGISINQEKDRKLKSRLEAERRLELDQNSGEEEGGSGTSWKARENYFLEPAGDSEEDRQSETFREPGKSLSKGSLKKLYKDREMEKWNIEDIIANLGSVSDAMLLRLREKINSGFYSPKAVKKYAEMIEKELDSRQHPKIRLKAAGQKEKYRKQIQKLSRQKEPQLQKKERINGKTSLNGDESYFQIKRIISEVEKKDYEDGTGEAFLTALREALKEKGESELKNIVSRISPSINKSQYIQLEEKIRQYNDLDIGYYIKHLKEEWDKAKYQEIASFVNRVNTKDRDSMMEAYHKLNEGDYEKDQIDSFLKKLYDKIYAMDEAAIKKICPMPQDLTFDEGIEVYEEILRGDFLPELKAHMLETIEQRLEKMKTNECEQLIKKLRKDMNYNEEEYPRVYFCDEENMDSVIIKNALNTYAADRGKYEYPIIVCDGSFSANGGTGFVLTPDYIYYNNLITLGKIKVIDIERIFADNSLFGKGVYIKQKNKEKVKISNSLKFNNLKAFAKVLDEFAGYLKEKPESRNISYMAEEKHEVKCCYRCGYEYIGGNVCPNCGSKFND